MSTGSEQFLLSGLVNHKCLLGRDDETLIREAEKLVPSEVAEENHQTSKPSVPLAVYPEELPRMGNIH